MRSRTRIPRSSRSSSSGLEVYIRHACVAQVRLEMGKQATGMPRDPERAPTDAGYQCHRRVRQGLSASHVSRQQRLGSNVVATGKTPKVRWCEEASERRAHARDNFCDDPASSPLFNHSAQVSSKMLFSGPQISTYRRQLTIPGPRSQCSPRPISHQSRERVKVLGFYPLTCPKGHPSERRDQRSTRDAFARALHLRRSLSLPGSWQRRHA